MFKISTRDCGLLKGLHSRPVFSLLKKEDQQIRERCQSRINARDFLLYVISELKENENRNSHLPWDLMLFKAGSLCYLKPPCPAAHTLGNPALSRCGMWGIKGEVTGNSAWWQGKSVHLPSTLMLLTTSLKIFSWRDYYRSNSLQPVPLCGTTNMVSRPFSLVTLPWMCSFCAIIPGRGSILEAFLPQNTPGVYFHMFLIIILQ